MKKFNLILVIIGMMFMLCSCSGKNKMTGTYKMTGYRVEGKEQASKNVLEVYEDGNVYYGVLTVRDGGSAEYYITEKDEAWLCKYDEGSFTDSDNDTFTYIFDEAEGKLILVGKKEKNDEDGTKESVKMTFEKVTDEIKAYTEMVRDDEREEVLHILADKGLRMADSSENGSGKTGTVQDTQRDNSGTSTSDDDKAPEVTEAPPERFEVAPTEEPLTSTPVPEIEPEPTKAVDLTATPALEENIDLGGMEIIIRDWWSPNLNEEYPREPLFPYEEARNEYRAYMMDKYNFSIREAGLSDWGGAIDDYIDYTTTGGDENNYVFCLHLDGRVNYAMDSGLMHDLASLDCINFSEEKYMLNKVDELCSRGSSVYALYPGYAEPGIGVYFNKKILKSAGVDPEDIYNAQENGTWTWDMFEEIMKKCQKKGYQALACDKPSMTEIAVFSNNGSFINNENGKYVYNLESEESLEALQWCSDIYSKYYNQTDSGDDRYYYQREWAGGNVAFYVDQEYQGYDHSVYWEINDCVGFVMFPKGPKAEKYVNLKSSNEIRVYVIPTCYDQERAWKIAFAWQKFTDPIPGYEDYNGYYYAALNGDFDDRAYKETIPFMCDKNSGVVSYASAIYGIDVYSDLLVNIGADTDVRKAVAECREKWENLSEDKSYVGPEISGIEENTEYWKNHESGTGKNSDENLGESSDEEFYYTVPDDDDWDEDEWDEEEWSEEGEEGEEE